VDHSASPPNITAISAGRSYLRIGALPIPAIKNMTDWVSLHPKEVICTLPPAGVTKSCSGFTTHDLILSSFGNLVAKVPRFRQGAAVSSSLDSGYALRAAAQWGACLVIGSE